MNYKPRPFRRSPKDFETLNERDEDDDDDEGGREEEGGETEDRGQTGESEFKGRKASHQRKAMERPGDQGRRIFTIPKVPVLQKDTD